MSFVKKVLFAVAFVLGLSAAIELSFFHIAELVNEKTRLTMLSDDITWYSGDPLAADKRLGMSDISRHIYEDPVYTTIPMKEVYLSRFSFSYMAILFRQMALHFYDYHLGKEAWTYFAYGGYYQGWLLPVLSAAILGIGLLAGSAEDAPKNVLPMKIGTFSFALIAEMLVYSALYVSFTPVGASEIIGVQGYYMIPLVWPLVLILWNRKLGDLLHIRKTLGQSGWYGMVLSLSTTLLV